MSLLAPKELSQVVIPDEQVFMFAVRQRRVSKRVFDAVQFVPRVQEGPKRLRDFVNEGAAACSSPSCGRYLTVKPAGRLIVPLSGSSNPASMRRSVVLPAPFGPQSPTRSSSETCHDTRSSRTRSPKRFVRPESWICR